MSTSSPDRDNVLGHGSSMHTQLVEQVCMVSPERGECACAHAQIKQARAQINEPRRARAHLYLTLNKLLD